MVAPGPHQTGAFPSFLFASDISSIDAWPIDSDGGRGGGMNTAFEHWRKGRDEDGYLLALLRPRNDEDVAFFTR